MSSEIGSRFLYRYAALLRKQEWDTQILSMELAQLQIVIRTHESQRDRLENEALECIQLLREAMTDVVTPLQRVRQEILDTYIASLQTKRTEQIDIIDQLKTMETQLTEQLTESKKSEQTLTRLRDQDQHVFQVEMTRKQISYFDDAWLCHTSGQRHKP